MVSRSRRITSVHASFLRLELPSEEDGTALDPSIDRYRYFEITRLAQKSATVACQVWRALSERRRVRPEADARVLRPYDR